MRSCANVASRGVDPDPGAVTFNGSTAIDPDPPAGMLADADVNRDESLLPALGITEVDGEIWVLHNLPDVVPFGEVLECAERAVAYGALRPTPSRASLTDPEKSSLGQTGVVDVDDDGYPPYVVRGGEGLGWLIGRSPAGVGRRSPS